MSCAVRCGDGLVGTGEQCDDGGTVGGDGCSATCQTEAAGSCPTGMRLIPAGMFLMGSTYSTDEQPVHGVRLSAFCMDETEVTVAEYANCAGCSAPDTSRVCNWGVTGRENHPVNCVDWDQARAYCQSRGASLPTEAQWEYAARGTDGRTYPWGNTAPASQVCWMRVPTPELSCPVRSYPLGDSPFGLADMGGNIREWTADWYAPYSGSSASYVMNPTGPSSGTYRVHRGGGWASIVAAQIRAADRHSDTVSSRVDDIGFRCVRGAL